jgi:hypothetical protein
LGVYWKSVIVLVPNHWEGKCVESTPSQGEQAQLRMGQTHPVYKDSVWTQQSKPCGQQGDFLYLSYKPLMNDDVDISEYT